MKISVKKSTDKLLILRYYKGYDMVLVTAIVSFFLAGLAYWFLFPKASFDEWKHAGPLLKRTPNEVLFRMPMQAIHQNIYVPLNVPFVRYDEEKDLYQLIFIGRTSERRKIYQKYELKVGSYHTKKDAQSHYQEIMDFLRSSDPIFLHFSADVEDRRTPEEKWLRYAPFVAAGLISLIVFFARSSHSVLTLDKYSNTGKLSRGNFLVKTTRKFKMNELQEAELEVKPATTDHQETLSLNLKLANGMIAVCKYQPPYEDDKMIVGLAQHARLINWWKSDNFIEKYGDRVLKES